MPDDILIRTTTVEDARHVARHRTRMFEDMRQLEGSATELLRAETMRFLETAIPSGEYLGWLAYPTGRPAQIVAGAGVQRRRVMPHPRARGEPGIAIGNHAIVLNVYTEPAWRRRGIAVRLMEAVIRWAEGEQLDRLVLHASTEGRPLYERLGFVATNEMRLNRPLAAVGPGGSGRAAPNSPSSIGHSP